MNTLSFFIYLAQVCIYAGVLWGIYCAVWRGRPLLRGSRVYLLCSLVLPLVLPFIRLSVAEHSAVAVYRAALPEVVIGGNGGAEDAGFSWTVAAFWTYITVAAGLLLLYGRSYLMLFGKLAAGKRRRCAGYTLITGAGIGPGTIGRRVFFPADEVNAAILRHELGHVRAGHRYDAALMQALHVIFWASPAHWLMRRELKLVHEYEADRAAVSSASERVAYGALMLSQSLGTQDTSIVHSFFHHPLKLRIMMLQKTNVRFKSSIVIGACLLTSMFISTVLLAQIRKTAPSGKAVEKTADKPKPSKTGESTMTNDGKVVHKFVEHMPAFNGELSEWLGANLVYPDVARKANQQGRSVVQFVVNDDGRVSDAEVVKSSGHPLLDKEALRAVNMMPPWKAGTQDGQAVAVYFTLPITFKLDN